MCYYPAVVCSRWLEIRLDWVAITTVLLTTLMSVLTRHKNNDFSKQIF